MLVDDTDTTKISGILHMRRRYQPGKCNRRALAEREPPMPPVKCWKRRVTEECEPMQICKRVRNLSSSCPSTSRILYMGCIFDFERPDRLRLAGMDHLASIALTPNQTAPTNPVTMMVITALKV